jgi:hypothetical protein
VGMKLPRFQFRLRTLMIGVTLLAVACWVVVDRQRLIRERDEALQREAAGLQREAMLKNGRDAIDRLYQSEHNIVKELIKKDELRRARPTIYARP